MANGAGTLQERQRKAFESRKIDISLLDSKKVILLEGDTAAERLGLQETKYLEVRSVERFLCGRRDTDRK